MRSRDVSRSREGRRRSSSAGRTRSRRKRRRTSRASRRARTRSASSRRRRATISKERDASLNAAKQAIDAVDPLKPGETIKVEIAKIQIWIDDKGQDIPNANLVATVIVARQTKEAAIAKATKDAADAKKAPAPTKPADAKATDPTKPADAKATDPATKAADPNAPADPKVAAAKAEKEKHEKQLELLDHQLELLMEKSLQPFEGFNAAASIALGACSWLALMNPAVAIPVVSIKLIAGFSVKYTKYRALMSSKTLLKQMTDAQPERPRGDVQRRGAELLAGGHAREERGAEGSVEVGRGCQADRQGRSWQHRRRRHGDRRECA